MRLPNLNARFVNPHDGRNVDFWFPVAMFFFVFLVAHILLEVNARCVSDVGDSIGQHGTTAPYSS